LLVAALGGGIRYKEEEVLDRFASPLAVRPKEASDGFHTIGDVMLLTASAHVDNRGLNLFLFFRFID